MQVAIAIWEKDFLEQFQAIEFYGSFGDPINLYGDSIKITYKSGTYEMVCSYTAEYVEDGEIHFLWESCDEEEFNALVNSFLE